MSDQRKGRGMPVQKKRIDEIDVIKAIGIILMVVGHAEAPMKQFLYLFHMAIFFIASGFFFKPSSSDSHKAVAKTSKPASLARRAASPKACAVS